jgi:hypothetical protein
MIQIKVAAYQNVATGEASPHELTMMDWEDDGETVESLITMTDHLAAMAEASARSGELAELLRDALRGLENVGLQDSYINYEDVGETMKRINVFLACAKARAKAGGE